MAGGIDSFTVLMLHCNGTDGSTAFTDVSNSAHSVTANGSFQVATAQSEFGGASGHSDGADASRLTISDSADWDFGNSDFTIDFWYYPTSLSGTKAIITQWGGGGSNGSFYLDTEGSTFKFYYSTDGSSENAIASSATLTNNTWQHIAVSRSGSNLYFFLNGTLTNTVNIGTVTFFNSTRVLNISTYADGTGQSFTGYIDEIRISKGVARYTSTFSVETEEYTNGSNSASPSILTLASSVQSPSEIISTTITPSIFTLASSLLDPLAGVLTIVNPSIMDGVLSVQAPSLLISSNIFPSIVTGILSTLSPTFPGLNTTDFGVRILSINPLLFVSNNNPPDIVNVDTTDPENPTWIVYTISGITTVYDAFINDTNDYIYVAADAGKVVKIEIADLTNQIIFNLSDSDNISTIDGLPLFGLTYAGTDSSTGELYLIDERDTFKINSDFEVLQQNSFNLDSDFELIHAFKMDSDFKVLSYNKFFIHTDFKCLTDELNNISPIKQRDFHIFIDDVEVIDPDLSLDSITITHTIDQESTATFKLNRNHDNLNYNLLGDFIEITNQNDIRIEINGNIEFPKDNNGYGKIGDLDCQYDVNNESVLITAYATQPNYQFNNVKLSLPSLNKRLGLYDVLVQNPKIFNPYIDPRIIIVSNDGEYWTNSNTWSFSLDDVKVFSTYQDALNYITNNSTNYTFTAKNPSVGYPNGSPKKFLGIIASLGQQKEQQVSNSFESDPFGDDANAITDGSFIPLQNWTYFWGATVIKSKIEVTTTKKEKAIPAQPTEGDFSQIKLPIFTLPEFKFPGSTSSDDNTSLINFLYIGTSLAPISSDIWVLKHAERHRQRIYEDKITELGFYSIGSAPFKVINPRNGILLSKWRYSDGDNGLYSITPESYNFTDFVKKVVDLEYEKLKNINNEILPETRCTLRLTIDSYYYNALKLLTRINIDNTTKTDIFNNNNGFPVSIKSVTIQSNDMSVSLQTDNLMSPIELARLDSDFPDDVDFIKPEIKLFIVPKSDMRTRLQVE